VLLFIKGAPDILLKRCNSILLPSGQVTPLTEELTDQLATLQGTWSSQGQRVLLLARRMISTSEILPKDWTSEDATRTVLRDFTDDLTVVGMIGIVDPLRKDIPEVVRICRGGGIRFFMVTGDFARTAEAIARQCGIITMAHVDSVDNLDRNAPPVEHEKLERRDLNPDNPNLKAIVISGDELITLNPAQWDQLCQYDEIVFARTTPEQKLRIVREFQGRGNCVGMTGDGVNDAPSLKAADIGIAMGSGSDVAIEAADMVLLESFSAIVVAIEYGRLVFDNLKKTIIYLLPAGSWSELWPVLLNVFFGLPQVLSSFLMIIICTLTDCVAASTLVFEKPEADLLTRPPRDQKTDRLANPKLIFHAYGFIGMIQCTTSMAMAFWSIQRAGIPFSVLWFSFGNYPAEYDINTINQAFNTASSIYFVNLVIMQFFNLMGTRTRRLSILQQPPLFNKRTQNYFLFPAMAFGLAVRMFLGILALTDF
jgi:sodium/potassium-transporting ATPase subunit alpha